MDIRINAKGGLMEGVRALCYHLGQTKIAAGRTRDDGG
jgi:hypothetical protein